MNQYGKKQYWNERYQSDPEPFEWYQKFSALKPVLLRQLQEYTDPKILMIGCGNSKFSEHLYDLGYKQITNIDFSGIVIDQMSDRYRDSYSKMIFLEMDACDMTFENNSFDFIIDKGLLDSILCSENSSQQALVYIKEID